ncbi:hypothetical protein ABXN37_18340 [Piscinibacter sakaiensis]
MGAIAEAGADRVLLTSDNPRRESPQAILADRRPTWCWSPARATRPRRRSAPRSGPSPT